MYTLVQLTVSSSKSRCGHQLNWALASDIPSWLQNEPDDLFTVLGRLSCGRRTGVTGSTWHAWWRRRSSGRRSWSDSSSKRWRLPGRSASISGAPSDSSAASSWMRSSLPAASRSRRDVSGLPLLSGCQTGFDVFLFYVLHYPLQEVWITWARLQIAIRAALPIPTSVCCVFRFANNGLAASVWNL